MVNGKSYHKYLQQTASSKYFGTAGCLGYLSCSESETEIWMT